MSEVLYTYKRVLRPDGKESYERVEYDPNAPVSEPPVLVPRYAPQFKNGEQPGSGSAVVDRILANNAAGALKRRAADELEASQKAEQARIRRSHRPEVNDVPVATLRFKRVLEP